jgi:hypothetical protein
LKNKKKAGIQEIKDKAIEEYFDKKDGA